MEDVLKFLFRLLWKLFVLSGALYLFAKISTYLFFFTNKWLAVLVMAAIAWFVIRGVQYLRPGRAKGLGPRVHRYVFLCYLVIGAVVFFEVVFYFALDLKSMLTPCGGNVDRARVFRYPFELNNPYDIVADGGAVAVNSRNAIQFFDPDKRKFIDMTREEGSGPQRIYYNTSNGQLVAGAYETNDIYIFGMKSNTRLARLQAPDHHMIDVDFSGGHYYILAEHSWIYDIGMKDFSLAPHRVDDNSLPPQAYALRINNRTKTMYVSGWVTGFVSKLDLRTLKSTARRSLWTYTFGMAVNEQYNTLLIAEPLFSRIAVLDGDTLETRRYIKAGLGVRDIFYNPATGKVHSANYIGGTYTRSDYTTGRLEKSIRIGGLARGVYNDVGTGDVYAVSKCGAFRIKEK